MSNRRWQLGFSEDPTADPLEWVEVETPTTVQGDWALAHGWPDWWRAEEFRRYRWMEDVTWTYRLTGDGEPTSIGLTPTLGELVVSIDGKDQGRPHLTDTRNWTSLPEGWREVRLVFPPQPSLPKDGTDRRVNTASTRPGVFYGWDFAPRLVPVGFLEPVLIDDDPITVDVLATRLKGFWELIMGGSGCDRIELYGPDGSLLDSYVGETSSEFNHLLLEPKLWWPRGYGEQNLYRVEAIQGDRRVVRHVGLRTVRFEMNEGAWGRPEAFPMGRHDYPIRLFVNDVPIFGKGANWVPPSMLPPNLPTAEIEELVRLAAEANFNMIRVWGGGGRAADAFYDACDRAGILVWQEFPLACATYATDDDYLENLEQYARDLVWQLKHHPCLAFWCGGNELFNAWSGMTDHHPALRLLAKVAYEMDPNRPFVPTSPMNGMGHGGYTFRYLDGRTGMEAFQRADRTAYTEFGSAGPASVEVLKEIIPAEELWPPREGTNWEWHNGLRGWDGHDESWLMPTMLRDFFGPLETLEELVEAGQILQSEGLKHCYEEARRQAPRCSMALSWCFNEPWPTAANCSMVSWPARPKPAYFAVKESLQPTVATIRLPRIDLAEGETVDGELWLLNDAAAFPEGLTLVATLDGHEIARLTTDPLVGPNPILIGTLPVPGSSQRQELVLTLPEIGVTNRYQLIPRYPGRPAR